MAASKEWTEWHLRPNGWTRGTVRTDSTIDVVERPNDAIATWRYLEEIAYAGRPDCKTSEIWRSNITSEQFISLQDQFGDCPQSLF
jgi:hypothetical protein